MKEKIENWMVRIIDLIDEYIDEMIDAIARLFEGENEIEDRTRGEDMTDYTLKLITAIEAVGQELRERSAELAGDSIGVTDFKIEITFEQPGPIPIITCKKSIISKKAVEAIDNGYSLYAEKE